MWVRRGLHVLGPTLEESCELLFVGGGERERGRAANRNRPAGRPGLISEASHNDHQYATPPANCLIIRRSLCNVAMNVAVRRSRQSPVASHFSADRQVGQTCWVPSPRVEYCCSSPVQRPSARQPALSQPSVAVLRRSAHRYHSIITRDGECRHRSPPAGAAPLPSRLQP